MWAMVALGVLAGGVWIWGSGGAAAPDSPDPGDVRAGRQEILPTGPETEFVSRDPHMGNAEARVAQDPPVDTTGSQRNRDGDGFPADYHGVRDRNVLYLYETFEQSVAYQAKCLSNPETAGDALRSAELIFALHSAYVALIQQQRHYAYGYGSKARPVNTRDTLYHAMSMGGMCLILELTRAEFPQVFGLMERADDSAAARATGSQRLVPR